MDTTAIDIIFHDLDLDRYDADFIVEARSELAALRARIAELEAQAATVSDALLRCGIAGINDEFHGPADAIYQMAEHIKDQAAQPSTPTPRRCVTGVECFNRGAKAMREESAVECDEQYAPELAVKVRALPIPPCPRDCNPLEPSQNSDHECACPCGCDESGTKQDDHGKWWCEHCYNDYMGIAPSVVSERDASVSREEHADNERIDTLAYLNRALDFANRLAWTKCKEAAKEAAEHAARWEHAADTWIDWPDAVSERDADMLDEWHKRM